MFEQEVKEQSKNLSITMFTRFVAHSGGYLVTWCHRLADKVNKQNVYSLSAVHPEIDLRRAERCTRLKARFQTIFELYRSICLKLFQAFLPNKIHFFTHSDPYRMSVCGANFALQSATHMSFVAFRSRWIDRTYGNFVDHQMIISN